MLNAEYNKAVGLKKAKEDVIEYNYSNYFLLNAGQVPADFSSANTQAGFLADASKKIMMQSESLKQDEVEGKISYRVSYTQAPATFTIPKKKTIIKGGYIN